MSAVLKETQVAFGLERLRDIMPEVHGLWEAHFAETEGYLGFPMNPNMEQFFRMEDAGMFRQFTARVYGKLIGHMGFIVHVDRHTSLLSATEDYFFLDKAHRQGFNALRFLRFAIAALRTEGCKNIGMSSKLTNDIGPLLRRVGFRHVGNYYVI